MVTDKHFNQAVIVCVSYALHERLLVASPKIDNNLNQKKYKSFTSNQVIT